MTGYRTTIFAALLIMFGALQAALPDLQKAISPTWYPYILIVVGTIVQMLRLHTSTPIFTKEGEPPKTLYELIVATGSTVILIMAIVLSPTLAPAAVKHDNGLITLASDEAKAFVDVLDQLDALVKKQGTMIREQQRQIDAFQKGKCL